MLISDAYAIYDDDDGTRLPGIADSDDFQESADDYDNIGAHDWETVVEQLQEYVDQNGLIDVLYIFDLGSTYVDENGNPTGDHAQQFGDTPITPEQIEQIADLLADDAVIILGGCNVAEDADYVEALAEAADATAMASDAPVQYDPQWFDDDFQSQGEWEVYTPDGEEPSDTPEEIGLDTVLPPDGGGGKAGTNEEPVAAIQQIIKPAITLEHAVQIDLFPASNESTGRSTFRPAEEDFIINAAPKASGLGDSEATVRVNFKSLSHPIRPQSVAPTSDEPNLGPVDRYFDMTFSTYGIGGDLLGGLFSTRRNG